MGAPKRAAAPRTRIVAGYVLGEVLGEGTFGKVRLATKDGVQYAVKILDRILIDTNEWTGKVRREIAIMRALTHPNIVRLHQVIRSPSRVYLVMELVTGGELYWKIQNEGALSEKEARAYFQQLVDGIAYCHSRGVYHRDLKPENILLSEDETTLKVTDFGLSAVNPLPNADLLLRTPCGSPHYCAPEVRGKRITPGYDGAKIDAWSCGVILFLLCTGWLPFHHDESSKLQAQINAAVVHYPDFIPQGAREICNALLEKNPRKRATLESIRRHPWFIQDYTPARFIIPVITRPASTPASTTNADASADTTAAAPSKQSTERMSTTHEHDDDDSEISMMLPSKPRRSLPTSAVSVSKPKSRRRRLKSTLVESSVTVETDCAPVRSVKSVPGPNVELHKQVPALNRAPSLVLGDAPASPRSAYDANVPLASSSLSSSSFERLTKANKKRTAGGLRRKAGVSFKLFAMSDAKEYRGVDIGAEGVRKTNSKKLVTFGIKMLSSFGAKRRKG